MPGPGIPGLALLVLLPLAAWRLYARFRRLVGRQRLSRIRPWVTLTLFPVLVVLLAWLARHDALALALLAAALALGAVLGRFGLARTRFEANAEGLFYTPHATLGVALLALLAARVLYRLVELGTASPHPAAVASPLTAAIFGLLAGYYIAYAIGLLLWRKAVRG